MTKQIGMFALVVPDYDAAISFYVDALGFELVEDTDQGQDKRWVVVRFGSGANLLLARAVNAQQRQAIGNQTGGRVGFFLETDDFDGDFARFKNNNVHFEEPPRTEPYGKVAVFQDPFGNRWDLIQFTP